MKKLAVFGASGHGKVVADLAEQCGYQVDFFDDAFPQKKGLEHWLVKGDFADLLKQSNIYSAALVAIGDNKLRAIFSKKLALAGFTLPVLIHPSAIVSQYAMVNCGTVVLANVTINAFAKVGKNCIINTGVIVEHDCIIGEHIHLSPQVALAGGTIIGDMTWVGIGTVTRQLIKIGQNVMVGANSTVIKNIPDNVTVFGSPAIIKTNHFIL